MADQSFSVSLQVDRTPKEVFNAINDVRGWWSQEIDGRTDRLGAVFHYHYKEVHRCTFKITEFVPGKKVVWRVVDNYFNFTKDATEWKGTDVVFEIAKMGTKTEIRFTHVGLVPVYECYNVCSEAWGSYITGSLRNLIIKGKGNPNPIEEVVTKARRMSSQNFTTSFTVDQSPKEVFAAVNNVRGWWSQEIEGTSGKLGAEFTFQYKDLHRSVHKVIEFVTGRKVVWQTTDSCLNFVKDKTEWNGTDIVFEITSKDGKTLLCFTHVGLAPAAECYNDCSDAWDFYINDSLRGLIEKGKGRPNPKTGKSKS